MFLNKQLIIYLYYLLHFQYKYCYSEINETCIVQGGIGICIPATECPKYKPHFQNTWLAPDIVDDINNNKCGPLRANVVCCSLPKVSPPITMRPRISNTDDSDGDVKTSTSSALTSLITKLYPDTKTATTLETRASSTASPYSSTKRSILSRTENNKDKNLDVINALPILPPFGYQKLPVLQEAVNNFSARKEINETCIVQGGIGICIPATECPKYKPHFGYTWLAPDIVDDINNNKCGSQRTKVCCSLSRFSSPNISISRIIKTNDSDDGLDASTSTLTSFTTTLYPDTTTTTTLITPASSTASPYSPRPRSILPRTGNNTKTDDNESNSINATGQNLDVINALPTPPLCGYQKVPVLNKVVNGFPAKLGYFPWMALLGYRVEGTTFPAWLCGGSIITARHILTAAHCIEDRKEDLYVVRVGELDLDRDDDGATPVDILIKTKVVHPGYRNTTNLDDIGILVLAETIRFTDLVSPICMPINESLRQKTFENYNPMLSGWGALEFRGPASSRLQGAMILVISNKNCENFYSSKPNIVVDQTVLCTYSSNKGSCQGDSGSPLAQPVTLKNVNRKRPYDVYQTGVVSSGGVCGVDPSVYTRVTHYTPWIEQIVTGTRL